MPKFISLVLVFLLLINCKKITYESLAIQNPKNMNNDDWKEKLSPEAYHVLREKGTERPFTSAYNDFYEKGFYVCNGCGNKLFTSDHKFNSHCGWPSFDQSIEASVKYIRDTTHGMIRTEVVCAKCDGHLGHLFEDGPTETTGERYCMNSVSLHFVPEN